MIGWEQPDLLESLSGAVWQVTEERQEPGLPLSDPTLLHEWGTPHLTGVTWTDPDLEPRMVPGGYRPTLGVVDGLFSLRAVFREDISVDRVRTDMAALLGQVLGWSSARSGEVLQSLEPNEGRLHVHGVPARSYYHTFEAEASADLFVKRMLDEADPEVSGWDGFGTRTLETAEWRVQVTVPVVHVDAKHGSGVSMLRIGPDGHVEYVHGADRVLSNEEVLRLARDALARNGWPAPTWSVEQGTGHWIDKGCAGAGF